MTMAAPSSATAGGSSNGAAHALALLLREDPLLLRHGLTSDTGQASTEEEDNDHQDTTTARSTASTKKSMNNNAAHSYASALLHVSSSSSSANTNPDQPTSIGAAKWMTSSASGEYRQRATEALADVDRKLAFIDSLCQRITRESPELIAGPLLRCHGYDIITINNDDMNMMMNKDSSGCTTTTTTLSTIRDKAERIERQSHLLATIAKRVEETLHRGTTRMETITIKLSRVLDLSSTLKMMLRLQFEARKVLSLHTTTSISPISATTADFVDLRDLTRAAASVAAMEGLLSHPSLTPTSDSGEDNNRIHVVEKLRPRALAVANSVRKAAAGLMDEIQRGGSDDSSSGSGCGGGGSIDLTRLGATLQVYFHLGELPDAAWKAVISALHVTEKASSQLFHPTSIKKTKEAAQLEAKMAADAEISGKKDTTTTTTTTTTDKKSTGNTAAESSSTNNPRLRKKVYETTYERIYQRKLCDKRAAAAQAWSESISNAAIRVWNLHRVLARRNDPVTRTNFLDVVCDSTIPSELANAERTLLMLQQNNNRNNNDRSSGKSGSSTTIESSSSSTTKLARANFSLFSLFWVEMSIGLGGRITRLLKYDNGALVSDIAALYPAVRSASLLMVTELYDIMQMGLSMSSSDTIVGIGDMYMGGGGGGLSSMVATNLGSIMGGSTALEDSVIFGGTLGGLAEGSSDDDYFSRADEAAGGGGGGSGYFGVSADTWTHVETSNANGAEPNSSGSTCGNNSSSTTSSLTLAVFTSPEWMALQGDNASDGSSTGLLGLQTAFLNECKSRLFAPLRHLFPEAVSVDENGIAIPCLPTLPTRYDLAKLDANIRDELSFADPRQGGGDFSLAPMIGDVIVSMLEMFCDTARRALSECDEGKMLDARSGSLSESMAHNISVAGVMSSLASFVRNAPDNTFVNPYRPAQSAQHEEASHSCRIALLPALKEIDSLVKTSILDPLCRALNRQLFSALVKMHRGTYLQESADTTSSQQQHSSFVQIYLADQYDNIASTYLTQLPNEYAVTVASTVATFSIYCFVSNAALLRPLGESSRLRLTQDLADFEMALEQLIFKGGTSLSLSQIGGGKPYAELRALRQLLYWTALEDKTLSPAEVAKGLLRDTWVKDLRPSTLFHFLFSFAPALLTSPHHFKRMDAGDYVGTLVKLDGNVDDGEAGAWMTTMACCDSYQQRESVDVAMIDGDRRIGAILMVLGPELLRRRRQ